MKKELPLNAGVHALLRRHTSKVILLLILLRITALSSLSVAQQIPRVQVFGGYSYTRFDSPTLGFANPSNLNGFNISPAFNLAYGFGVKVELTGQYGSKVNLRDLTVGPQFLYPRGSMLFFADALFAPCRLITCIPHSSALRRIMCESRPGWCIAGTQSEEKDTNQPYHLRSCWLIWGKNGMIALKRIALICVLLVL